MTTSSLGQRTIPAARSSGAHVVAIAVIVITIALGACGGSDAGRSEGEQPTFSFVIPAGSGDLIARGESVDILPAEMTAKIGETIQIVNEDDIGHALGPWYLGPKETIRQRFNEAGVFSGYCSVHPDESFTITVTES